MDTIGKRLRHAIERYGPAPRGRPGKKGTIRSFWEEFHDRVPSGYGKSRQMLHDYLADRVVPPAEFIRHAADLLGVSEEWLIQGTGPERRGDREATAAATVLTGIARATGSATIVIPHDSVFHVTGAGMPRVTGVARGVLEDTLTPIYDALAVSDRSGGQPWVPAILEVWRRMGSGVEGIQQDMKALGEALAAPLRALGLDPEDMEAGEVDAYVFGMVPTLLQLASIVRRQGVGEEG